LHRADLAADHELWPVRRAQRRGAGRLSGTAEPSAGVSRCRRRPGAAGVDSVPAPLRRRHESGRPARHPLAARPPLDVHPRSRREPEVRLYRQGHRRPPVDQRHAPAARQAFAAGREERRRADGRRPLPFPCPRCWDHDQSMSRGAGEDSSSFLTVAVEHALLSPQVAERISHQMTQRGAPPEEIALEEGLLDAIEVDIVQTLLQARDAVPGYEFLGVLGRGGMGVVCRARQLNLDREVAVKTLLLSQLTHRESLARFEREARTIGQLQHPNIVAAYDYGKHQGRLFLAMELVRGMDLGQYIQRQQRLNEATAWQIARQIAAGL